MSRSRVTALLGVALALLAAILALELFLGYRADAQSGVPPAPGRAPPPPLSPPTFELPAIAQLSETTARPLFLPGRRVPEEADEAAAQPASRARAPEVMRLALSAVVIVEDRRVALLNDIATGRLSRVSVGDRVGGWRVIEIRDDSVVIENTSGRQELALRTFLPPPATARSNTPGEAAQRSAASRDGAEASDVRRPRRPRRGPRQRRLRDDR